MRKPHLLVSLSIALVLIGLVVVGQAQGPTTNSDGRSAATGHVPAEDPPEDAPQANMAALAPFRSELTYLGSLTDGSGSADGDYDLEFLLYGSATLGAQIGETITQTVTITDGLFSTLLDFGADAFPGDARYLEIHVRQSGEGSFTTLSPRQELTAVPYAMSAYRANGLAAPDGDPVNAVYVDDAGQVGIGTNSPLEELHIVGGDTPAVTLDQDETSGWDAQVWRIGGNESNFFISDATHSDALPFRIEQGAPSNCLTIKADGYVGIGTQYARSKLHVANGYLQLDTSVDAPPAADCDAARKSEG